MITRSFQVYSRVNKVSTRSFVALATSSSSNQSSKAKPTNYQISQNAEKRRAVEEFYLPSRFRYVFDKNKDLIGKGFFANVYKAVDSFDATNVAVKVIDKKNCPKEVYQQELRVFEQMRTLSKKQKEGLGICKDVLDTKKEISMVFDLYEGGDLFDEVVDNGVLNESEAQSLMKRLLKTVSNLHQDRFLHRDIKLENILLVHPTSTEHSRESVLSTAQITDFGYARKLGERDTFKNPAGTFGYVAPEVLSSRAYSPACDIWSIGTVLFTCVAGYQPFPLKCSSGNSKTKLDIQISNELEAIEYGTNKVNWTEEMNKPAFKSFSKEFKNLLAGLLDPNPRTRLSATEALEHPWFTLDISESIPERAVNI